MTKTQNLQNKNNTTDVENFNSNVSGVPIIEVNYDLYKPQAYGNNKQYLDVNGEAVITEQLIKQGESFILEGDKGLGKTLLVHDICVLHNIGLIPLNCSSATTDQDLLGHMVIRPDGTFGFQLGVLPIAILYANKFGQAVLYADEFNAQQSDVQKVWNSILDDRRMVIANNIPFRLNKDAKLSVIGTMNPVSYSGVNPLNEDLVSRMKGLIIDTPQTNTIKEIVEWGKASNEVRDAILALSTDIRQLRSSGSVDYSLSTRDIQQFADMFNLSMNNVDDEQRASVFALKTCVLFKMPTTEQRQSIKNRISDIFGLEVSV